MDEFQLGSEYTHGQSLAASIIGDASSSLNSISDVATNTVDVIDAGTSVIPSGSVQIPTKESSPNVRSFSNTFDFFQFHYRIVYTHFFVQESIDGSVDLVQDTERPQNRSTNASMVHFNDISRVVSCETEQKQTQISATSSTDSSTTTDDPDSNANNTSQAESIESNVRFLSKYICYSS